MAVAVHPARVPDERAATDPTAPCLEDLDRRLNSAQFLDAVRRTAATLRRHEVRNGDVVAVMLPNRLELITVLFAAWRLGAAVTPVNPALTAPEARYQLDDARVALVVVDADSAPKVVGSHAATLPVDDVAGDAVEAAPPRTRPDDIALIVYTSGTTGRPKGVVLDHANLTAMADQLVGWFELSTTDRCLLILPLFHVNGLMASVVSPLAAGGATIVAPRFDPTRFWGWVARFRPTYFSAVPTIYHLLTATPLPRAPEASSLRFAVCGAAPMSPAAIARFEQRFGIPVIEGYGLSEGTVASTINPLRGPRKPGTVGVALPGQEVRIVDDDGRFLPPGQVGEVVIRGPTVMRGYLGRPDDTAQALHGGWLHTGDIGRLDEDGYLTLVDRKKDLIIRGGENIYPKEVEDVLYQHPDVLEVAVVGRPDPTYGEVPVAFVTPRPGQRVDPAQLVDFGRRYLARFKVPRQIVVLDHLPKNAVGKITKEPLRERARRSAPSEASTG